MQTSSAPARARSGRQRPAARRGPAPRRVACVRTGLLRDRSCPLQQRQQVPMTTLAGHICWGQPGLVPQPPRCPDLQQQLCHLHGAFARSQEQRRLLPTVLGIFIRSSLEETAGSSGVVHCSGPVQCSFSPFISGSYICSGCDQFFNQVLHGQPGSQHQRCSPVVCARVYSGLSAGQ